MAIRVGARGLIGALGRAIKTRAVVKRALGWSLGESLGIRAEMIAYHEAYVRRWGQVRFHSEAAETSMKDSKLLRSTMSHESIS